MRTPARRATDARRHADRGHHSEPPDSQAVHRKAGRAGHHICRPGGDRHRECPAAERPAGAHPRSAGIARIPDRDQRCAQGHQPIDLRPATGVGDPCGNRRAAVRCRDGVYLPPPGRPLSRLGVGRLLARNQSSRRSQSDLTGPWHGRRPHRIDRQRRPYTGCEVGPRIHLGRVYSRREDADDARRPPAARRGNDRRNRAGSPEGGAIH